MSSEIIKTANYKKWLSELKLQFQQAQIKASVKVNSTLLEFYWELAEGIIAKKRMP